MKARHSRSTTVARPVSPTAKTGERPVEKPLELSLHLPHAQAVMVAGTFNDWTPNRHPMRKNADGAWTTTVWLPPGRYEYRFVADGQWLSDPKAKQSVPNNFGSTNSVAVV